jgi:hypothetical protein
MLGVVIGVGLVGGLARVVRRVFCLAPVLCFVFVLVLAFRLAFIVESLGPLVGLMIANV